jgi:hypothetical protein
VQKIDKRQLLNWCTQNYQSNHATAKWTNSITYSANAHLHVHKSRLSLASHRSYLKHVYTLKSSSLRDLLKLLDKFSLADSSRLLSTHFSYIICVPDLLMSLLLLKEYRGGWDDKEDVPMNQIGVTGNSLFTGVSRLHNFHGSTLHTTGCFWCLRGSSVNNSLYLNHAWPDIPSSDCWVTADWRKCVVPVILAITVAKWLDGIAVWA